MTGMKLLATGRGRGSLVEARARRTGNGAVDWALARFGAGSWAIAGGPGIGLPLPGDLWHEGWRTRRVTGGEALWIERDPRSSPWGFLGVDRRTLAFELGFRRPGWEASLARHPRTLGGQEIQLRSPGDDPKWALSLERNVRAIFAGASYGREFNWDGTLLRARAWSEDRLRNGGRRPQDLRDPLALRSRRSAALSVRRDAIKADLDVEWRTRGTPAWRDWSSDRTGRWRFSARVAGSRLQGELRIARAQTQAYRMSEVPFVRGTRTRDSRATARLFVSAAHRDVGLSPGVEFGLEDRATNNGSWSGHWRGAWADGTAARIRWSAGLSEIVPAPGHSLSSTPRWVSGRSLSVSRRTLLLGVRLRARSRALEVDLRALSPLSPPSPPRIELALSLRAESDPRSQAAVPLVR